MPEDTNNIIIAIDGFSSCGKSTLARDIAERLGYLYIDSGAMYRAVTLYFLRNKIDNKNNEQVRSALTNISIAFKDLNGETATFLNGEDVEHEIRSMEVSMHVSPVSAISAVRSFLVAQQRILGASKGVVMDGRDIGSVVFPEAELKLFVTATIDERIKRRTRQLLEKGIEATPDEVRESITRRDHIDSSRDDSPLTQTDDAVVLDNTDMTREEQMELVLGYANKVMGRS